MTDMPAFAIKWIAVFSAGTARETLATAAGVLVLLAGLSLVAVRRRRNYGYRNIPDSLAAQDASETSPLVV